MKTSSVLEKIKIDEADITALERAHFEYRAARDTIAYLIESHATDNSLTDSASFNQYQEEQVEKLKIYENQKNIIALKYLPEKYLNTNAFWEIDFTNKEMIISGRE